VQFFLSFLICFKICFNSIMGKIILPKKIKISSIIKLLMLSVFIFAGFYFYPTFNKPAEIKMTEGGEILGLSNVPTKLIPIKKYNMGAIIRNECLDTQNRMDFTCEIISSTKPATNSPLNSLTWTQSGSNFRARVAYQGVSDSTSFGTSTNQIELSTGRAYYGNPVIEDMLGSPILFYYGGVLQVKPETDEVRLVKRTFETATPNTYTSGCTSGWYPSQVFKSGNKIVFGGGGLESFFENRCYNRGDNGGVKAWGTSITGNQCFTYANNVGVPLIKGCSPTATTESCWNNAARCETPFGFSQYYNLPFQTRYAFSKNSAGNLIAAVDGKDNQGPTSGGGGTRDATSICYGKNKSGSCAGGGSVLEYGTDLVLRMSATGANYYEWNKRLYAEKGLYLSQLANYKTFVKRGFYGENPNNTNSTNLSWTFGGSETPVSSYVLPERVDYFSVYSADGLNSDRYIKYKVVNYEINPAPNIVGWETLSGARRIQVSTGRTIADFASDKYFFTLQYANGNLVLYRFSPTGWNNDSITNVTTLAINSISLTYRKNISFSVTSQDDLDIMISPNFYESELNDTAKARVFRAKNFNAPLTTTNFKFSELTNLTQNANGYVFDNPGPGNNTPLSFRYFNTTDTNTNNDYAVFVSRNYVFTANIPDSPDCSFLSNRLVVANTNPNSLNKGISPTGLVGGNSNFSLALNFVAAPVLNCPSGLINIPAGTPMSVTLYDAIDTTPVKTFSNVTLGSNRLFLRIPNAVAPSNSKYLYSASFVYNGETYRTELSDTSYFGLESFININALISAPGSTVVRELVNPSLTITKTFGASSKQSNVTLDSSSFTLTSYALPASSNFFFDHNLVRARAGLSDQVTYKICFTNTSDTKILRVELDRDSSVISDVEVLNYSISNNCLNMNYRYPNTDNGYFMEPVTLNIYLTEGVSVTPTTYGNFKVNGNVMIKNTPNMGRVIKTDKKYQGVYVATVSKGEKSFLLNTNLASSYYKIPFFNNLTSAFNFEVVPDLVSSVTNYSLITDNSPLRSPTSWDEIDAFLAYPASSPRVVYIAKNKTILFDLTNQNIISNDFDGYNFVSATEANAKERIKFYVNCDDENYSSICQDGVEYNFKGGLYGDIKMTGSLNSANQNRAFIVVNQNPGIIVQGQTDLRDKRFFNFTRSKTIFKYLNQ